MKKVNNQCIPCSLDFRKEILNICSTLKKPIPDKGFNLFAKYNQNRDILTGCSKKFICSKNNPYLSQFVLLSHENKNLNCRKETAEELNLDIKESGFSTCPHFTKFESPKQVRKAIRNFQPSPWASTYQVYMTPERQSRPILPRFRIPPEEGELKKSKSSKIRKFQFNLEFEEIAYENKCHKYTQVDWFLDLNTFPDFSSCNEIREETILDSDLTFNSSEQEYESDLIHCPGRKAKREKALEEELSSSSTENKGLFEPSPQFKSTNDIRIFEKLLEKETGEVRILPLFTPLSENTLVDDTLSTYVTSSTSDIISVDNQYQYEETITSSFKIEDISPPPPPPSVIILETAPEMVDSRVLNNMLRLLCEKATQTDWYRDVYEVLYGNNE